MQSEETSTPAEAPPVQDLAEFESFFQTDLTPERIPFKIGGQPAWVDLLPLDSTDSDRYASIGLKFTQTASGMQMAEAEAELDRRNMFLVARTVVDACLWRRKRAKNSDGELVWEEVRLPQQERARIAFIEQQFRCRPVAWNWLVYQCQKINGLAEGQQGN